MRCAFRELRCTERSSGLSIRVWTALLPIFVAGLIPKVCNTVGQFDTICVLPLRYRNVEVSPMKLPFDPDSDEMGYWVDRWLHHRRIHDSTNKQLARDARRLARAVELYDRDSEILQDFMAFISHEPDN